jgi:beta-phosphoglucomutase-like phosphatase (HAD superfamily)
MPCSEEDMMDKILLTDVDGTLLDFATDFHYWMLDHGFKATGSLSQTFEIDVVYGCTREQALHEVEAFCEADVFKTLPPILGSLGVIRRLKALGWRVVAITSCHASPEARRNREENLAILYGIEPQDVIFAGLMGDKRKILANFPPAIWVDDHYRHIEEGLDAGHKCFVIDMPYNQQESNNNNPLVERISHWMQIEAWIKQQ